MRQIFFLSLMASAFLSSSVWAAGAPKVGRKAASRYFAVADPNKDNADSSERRRPSSSGDGLLMVHVGGYSSSTSYAWKDSTKRTGVGQANYGITYLFDQWHGMDFNFRFDFSEYKIDDQRASKLSFIPLFTFPRVETHFPIYFGLGAGPGVFFTQLEDESNLSLDYQLILGARWVDLYENFGVFTEFGLKNHIQVLSDGQFNGMAWSVGALFTF
jgi:hypothetical protein